MGSKGLLGVWSRAIGFRDSRLGRNEPGFSFLRGLRAKELKCLGSGVQRP